MSEPTIKKDLDPAWAERLSREQLHCRKYYTTQFRLEPSPDSDPYDKLHVPPFSNNRTPFAPSYSSWARKLADEQMPFLESDVAVEALPSRSPPPKTGVGETAVPLTAASRRSTGSRPAPDGSEQLLQEQLSLAATLSPARTPALSRHSHSASAPQLQSRAIGRQRTSASLGRSSHRSMKSHLSSASLRSKIGEAVQREIARSALGDYHLAMKAKEQRAREKILKMPIALRPAPGPVDMGCPTTKQTTQMESLGLPVKMQTDPRWNTVVPRINAKVGQRLEYERKLSASVTGAILPEAYHMPPKDYITNPPTPYFEPGKTGQKRSV